jgi:16S rRNA G966 N2-methylase RsmD
MGYKCVVLGYGDAEDREVYTIEAESRQKLEAVMQEWKEKMTEITSNNLQIFNSIFWEELDLEDYADAEESEQRSKVVEIYGDNPSSNPEYAKRVSMAQDKFRSLRQVLDWMAWFEKNGLQVEELEYMIEYN